MNEQKCFDAASTHNYDEQKTSVSSWLSYKIPHTNAVFSFQSAKK